MKSSYVKIAAATAIVMTASLFAGVNCTKVKVNADAAITSQQGVVVRSANLVTAKTIKVPPKSTTSKSTTSKSTSSGKLTLSRGNYTSGKSYSSSYSVSVQPSSGIGGSIVSYAMRFLGFPYVWGAEGPSAFDCSGFTAYVYSAFGIYLPHYTGSQAQMGRSVSESGLQPGDLVFFNTYGSISHVGIYIGGGQFIHAATRGVGVTISSLYESYYASRYACAVRIYK